MDQNHNCPVCNSDYTEYTDTENRKDYIQNDLYKCQECSTDFWIERVIVRKKVHFDGYSTRWEQAESDVSTHLEVLAAKLEDQRDFFGATILRHFSTIAFNGIDSKTKGFYREHILKKIGGN